MKGHKGKGNMVAPKGSAPAANIPGVEVLHQAKKKSGAFKDGGAVAKKDGGVASGMKSGGRMDRAPRKADGGGVSMRGRSPLSSASAPSDPVSGGKTSGY